MTDDRDQPWRDVAGEPDTNRSDDDTPGQAPGNPELRKTLSRALQNHESAIDRTVKAIDSVVDDLRAAAQLPQERGNDVSPIFPWRSPDTTVAARTEQAETKQAGSPEAKAASPEVKTPSIEGTPAQQVTAAPTVQVAKPVALAADQAKPTAQPEVKVVPAQAAFTAAPVAKAAEQASEQVKPAAQPEAKIAPVQAAFTAAPVAKTAMPAPEQAKPVGQPEAKVAPVQVVPAAAPVAKTAEQASEQAKPVAQPKAKIAPVQAVPAAAPVAKTAEQASEQAKPVAAPEAKAAPAPNVPSAAPVVRPAAPPATEQPKQAAAPETKILPQAAPAPVAKAAAPASEQPSFAAAPESKVAPQAAAPAAAPATKPASPAPEAKAAPAQTVPPVGPAVRQDGPAPAGEPVSRAPEVRIDPPGGRNTTEMKDKPHPSGMVTLDGDSGPVKAQERLPAGGGPNGGDKDRGGGGGGGGGGGNVFHKRLGPIDFGASLKAGMAAVKKNLIMVMIFTLAANILVLAIPVYLFQISDRVLTSRSTDTLVMLTAVIVGAVVLQTLFDAIRRFILMRTAVEVAAQLGAPILSAAARASLNGNGREYQTLGDLQQLRTFLTSGTLLAFLDAPLAPLFILAVFLIHPHMGFIVVTAALLLLIITLINQRATEGPFGEANSHQSKANVHLDSMARNSQIINALAMIPEAVRIWGRDTANSLRAQVTAQDRNIAFAAMSKGVRLLTQVTMLGWGAYLAIDGHVTGGMVIAGSIIAGRALGPIEGAIEGWNNVVQVRAAYGRIAALLRASPLNLERLNLPRPEGRLDVERLLFVPQGTKRVVLNGVTFALSPGDSLAIIGNSGAGKTTLGKMLVGSILPTSGNVRVDLMDLRNWDPRQFGENIGYLPQDVQLFPASIKANIARMRENATDADIYEAARLADVHEMIATLPHGYETVVAADGSPLSGGQKQRVALARAFFGNPRMVVLDEPNSNLDAAGDVALAQALQHAKEQKITVVTITQRPSLLKSVDKILLLVNGTVALFGMRPDVLQALAQRGLSIEGGSFGHQIP